jgi:hypothetical protein
VNALVRVDHVRGSLVANDGTQLLGVELGVERRAGEVLELAGVLALGVGQKVAKVGVKLRIVRQLVKDQMIYTSYFVSLNKNKQLY